MEVCIHVNMHAFMQGNYNPHSFAKYCRITLSRSYYVGSERRACFCTVGLGCYEAAGTVIKGQRMELKRDVSAPASHSLPLIYSIQAPSSPSSPSANEPKYEKRWLDAVSLPLFMARISRRKAGTDKLRYGNPP